MEMSAGRRLDTIDAYLGHTSVRVSQPNVLCAPTRAHIKFPRASNPEIDDFRTFSRAVRFEFLARDER